jgi:hypothetical protein
MQSYRYGALTIVEQAGDKNAVQRDLQQIDPRLFLEKQLTLDNQEVWCVMCQLDGDQPPLCVFEWRDPDTNEAIPVLSSGIVNRMARMERDPIALSRRVHAQNEAFKLKQREKFSEHVRGFAEMQARSFRSHIVLPRSPGLVMARRRQRRAGHNV